MKRIIVLALIAAFLVAVPVFNHLWADGVKNVTICHKGKEMTVSINALQAHLNHGDTEGPCP